MIAAFRYGRLVIILLAASIFTTSSLHADDWPCWRGPDRNGISNEMRWNRAWPETGPPVAWAAFVGTGFSSVSVADGLLVTMGNEDNTDTVHCLDAITGKTRWTHSYVCPLDDRLFEGGPTSTPTLDDGHVYTLSRQGHAFCFEASSGKIVWSKNLQEETGLRIPGWGFSGSPVVHGDRLLLAMGEAGTAVDKKTGRLAWKSADRDAGYATPVPFEHDGRWFAAIPSGRYVHAVDIQTGHQWWRHRWLTTFGCNAADPIVRGEEVFVSSGYNRGAALLKMLKDEAPDVVWSNKDLRNQFSTSVLIGDHLFGIDGDRPGERTLKCMPWETGAIRWVEESFSPGALTAADGHLILLTEEGELIVAAASPSRFEAVARARVLTGRCWTVPVLANGRIYCRNAEGDLVCLDVRPTP